MEDWIVPLTVIPGIAMLVLSTSGLSTSLGQEIDHLIHHKECDVKIVQRKVRQLSLLSICLVTLYLAIAFLTLAGFLGGLVTDMANRELLQLLFLYTGIGSAVVATILLIIYSIRAVSIKRELYQQQLAAIKKSNQNHEHHQ